MDENLGKNQIISTTILYCLITFVGFFAGLITFLNNREPTAEIFGPDFIGFFTMIISIGIGYFIQLIQIILFHLKKTIRIGIIELVHLIGFVTTALPLLFVYFYDSSTGIGEIGPTEIAWQIAVISFYAISINQLVYLAKLIITVFRNQDQNS